jgi:hypothetical protein
MVRLPLCLLLVNVSNALHHVEMTINVTKHGATARSNATLLFTISWWSLHEGTKECANAVSDESKSFWVACYTVILVG